MPRKPTRSTTDKGLGYAYQKKRAALPPPNGEPCPFPWCGHAPMWPWQDLDADHTVPRALGGQNSPLRWSHRRCNRRAGAHLGATRRWGTRAQPHTSENW